LIFVPPSLVGNGHAARTTHCSDAIRRRIDGLEQEDRIGLPVEDCLRVHRSGMSEYRGLSFGFDVTA
jgi:hypothetical protein